MGIFNFFKKDSKSKQEPEQKLHVKALAPTDEDLISEVLEFIQQEIKFGFDNKDEILESVWSAGFENEDELDENWLKATISKYYEPYQVEGKKWSNPTDFDKLAGVFDELNKQKIVALHKAGYTKQDGYNDVSEVVSSLKSGIDPIGYCFYHTQDLERAISPSSKSLFLAFDDFNQDDASAIAIGKTIQSLLHEADFTTNWDETVEQRIEIQDINWQKIPGKNPFDMNSAIYLLNQNE